jgi:hypothetical protein
MVSKSLAYIAIIAIISVAMFIIIMDVLKYFFNIDPIHQELERIQPKKKINKAKHPVIIKHIYVNAPLTQSSEVPTSKVVETNF